MSLMTVGTFGSFISTIAVPSNMFTRSEVSAFHVLVR
jgi:hypothetical protein